MAKAIHRGCILTAFPTAGKVCREIMIFSHIGNKQGKGSLDASHERQAKCCTAVPMAQLPQIKYRGAAQQDGVRWNGMEAVTSLRK